MSLADRLIAGLRAQEQDRGYGLERTEVDTVSDGLVWMRGTHEAYSDVWFGPNDSDKKRRRTIRAWLWLRWLYRDRWLERGGRDAC